MTRTIKRKPRRIYKILVFLLFFAAISAGFLTWRLKFAPKAQVGTRDDKPAKIIVSSNINVTLPPATPTIGKIVNAQSPQNNGPWGIAQQVDEHTWTMKIGEDERMATPQEVFDALNAYRKQKGVGGLTYDDKLAEFAKKRADTFFSIKKLDGHSGFNEYFKDEQRLKDIGFWGVGENSSFGFRLEGVHLIEWIFAGDKPHDDN